MTHPFRVWVCVVGGCLALVSQGGSADFRSSNVEYLGLPDGQGFTPAVDIVVVVDNSGSMGLEILSLEDELYDHLVGPLITGGADARVIVVSRHGDNAGESICFEAPLSSVPAGGCASPPAQPGITDIFKHYSVEVGSHDAWCLLMSTFDGTTSDEFGLAPGGWIEWAREGALKVVLMVTDDGVTCGVYDDDDSVALGTAAATAIDSDLLALSAPHFGTMSNRSYVVHSLVGLMENTIPNVPWPPTAPVTASSCGTAVSAGTGHQAMSVLTKGMRFPICLTTEYDTFLNHVALDTANRLPIFSDGFESGSTTEWSMVMP